MSKHRSTLPLVAAMCAAACLLFATSARAQVAPPATVTAAAPAAGSGDKAGDKAKARACFDAAQAAYVAGDLARARAGFECAYHLVPSPELAYNLARVCERMGEVQDGVRYYREYLARGSPSARERKRVEGRIRALLQLQERQAEPRKLDADARASLNQEARKFFERGVKLYGAQQYEAAQAAFAAAAQASDAPELHYNLALVAERLGHPRDACDHYRAYLAGLPSAADRVAVEAHIQQLQASMQ